MREGLRRDRESAVRVFCHYWSTVRPPLSPPKRMIPCMIVHSPYTGTTLSVQSSIDRFRVSGIGIGDGLRGRWGRATGLVGQ
jgi:hypothetical protein